MFSGVSYVCLQVFHLDVAYVCNGFQMFFKHFSQVFHTLVSCAFFYVAFGCFKSRSGVVYGMRVEAAGGTDDLRSGVGDVWG
jgi:hypothetical protein